MYQHPTQRNMHAYPGDLNAAAMSRPCQVAMAAPLYDLRSLPACVFSLLFLSSSLTALLVCSRLESHPAQMQEPAVYTYRSDYVSDYNLPRDRATQHPYGCHIIPMQKSCGRHMSHHNDQVIAERRRQLHEMKMAHCQGCSLHHGADRHYHADEIKFSFQSAPLAPVMVRHSNLNDLYFLTNVTMHPCAKELM